MFPAAVVQSPQALDAKAFQARCAELSKARDWKGLEGLSRAQIVANPKDAQAEAALGFALLAQDRAGDAKAACERAIALNRREAVAYLYLGLAYAQNGDRDGVLKTGRRLSEADPFGVKAYYQASPLAAAVGTDPNEVFIKEAKPLHQERWPSFPDTAKSMKIQGDVAYELHVGPDGIPTSVAVLAGPPQLATLSQLDFVKHTRFEPVIKDGHPVAFRTIQIFTFKLGTP